MGNKIFSFSFINVKVEREFSDLNCDVMATREGLGCTFEIGRSNWNSFLRMRGMYLSIMVIFNHEF